MTPTADPKSQDADRLNWDSLVEEGKAAARSQWTLGDLAREVETSYGGGELERYAEEIGVEVDRLRHYRSVSASYEVGVRTPDLTFSHFERIASRPDRLDWLSLASKGKWTVRQMLAEIDAAEAEARAEAERRKILAHLEEQAADLVEAVASDQLTLTEALAEMGLRQQKAEQERLDREGRIRRAKGRIEAFLGGWIEFQDFRSNPDREAILASLIPQDREQIIAIERQMWG